METGQLPLATGGQGCDPDTLNQLNGRYVLLTLSMARANGDTRRACEIVPIPNCEQLDNPGQ
jgi:hypothetical protein